MRPLLTTGWHNDLIEDARDVLEGTKRNTMRSLFRSSHQLNSFIVGEYRKLVRSEMGEWAAIRFQPFACVAVALLHALRLRKTLLVGGGPQAFGVEIAACHAAGCLPVLTDSSNNHLIVNGTLTPHKLPYRLQASA